MSKNKVAFFTMDVESFKHTGCVQRLGAQTQSDMLDGLDEYLAILERHGIRATLFFVLETALAISDKVRDYIRRGHKIAVHGLTHTPPIDMPLEEFVANTRRCKEELESAFGQEIIGYRAPFFSLNDERMGALKGMGFLYDASKSGCSRAEHSGELDVSQYEKLRDGVYRKEDFYEFELVCRKVAGVEVPVSGGGYARLVPWQIVKSKIKSHTKKSDYYVFYLHPFELSKEKIPKYKGLKPKERMYLTMGRKRYGNKIEGVIRMLEAQGYSFSTMEDFVREHKG